MTRMSQTPRSASTASTLARLLLIAMVLLLCVAAFAYAGGWLGGRGLNGSAMVDALQDNAGPHPGFRRNHAKGLCIAGTFEGNGNGARLSSSAFLQAGARAAVVGRMALAGGNPYAPDAAVPVRSMALQMRLPDGQEWRTGINDIPGFPVSTPQAFQQLTLASKPDPATGKPDPALMQAFAQAHPEFVAFGERLKASPRSSSFANDSYNGINAFVFIGADGARHLVRWSMQPELAFEPAAASAEPPARDALFDDLLARLDQGPLVWHLIVTVAGAGDASNQAALPWPEDRERIDVGTLTISGASSENLGGCRDIVYDPLVLPAGIEASDDPLLSARSSTYSVSYRRRAGEPPGDSALHDRQAGSAR
jgi:catalase